MMNGRTNTENGSRFPTDGIRRSERRNLNRKERHRIRALLNSRSGRDLAHFDSDLAELLDHSDGHLLPRSSHFEEHGA